MKGCRKEYKGNLMFTITLFKKRIKYNLQLRLVNSSFFQGPLIYEDVWFKVPCDTIFLQTEVTSIKLIQLQSCS